MRKLTAIVLVIFLLFNVLGFYGFFFTLRYHHQQSMLSRLDADAYSELEAITIKVPLQVPYALDQQEYKRIDGEFQHEGEHYRIVKQRLASDTLYVVCIRDVQGKRLQQALSDYVNTLSDDLAHEKSGSFKGLNFSKDFFNSSFSLVTLSEGWEIPVVHHTALQQFIPTFCSSMIHPPERA